jgi:type I restriction enzyme R subunit
MPNESDFELTTIERLKLQGYKYDYGPVLRENPSFPPDRVIITDLLKTFLQNKYPHLTSDAIEQAISIISSPEGADTLHRNKNFHQLLTRGYEVKYKNSSGREIYEHVYPIDWNDPDNNDFRVINQLSISGKNDRRPDIIIYINGLPLIVFELKNPYDESPTVNGAYNQIQHYILDMPQLFDYNAFCVISDGVNTLHGMFTAAMEWYAPWKSIDGKFIAQPSLPTMKVLLEGLFLKDRLLQYIRHFIVFEEINNVIVKKGAKYHQFFGVRFAVEEAIRATRPDGNRRIGVIWHTQGSGKSLSMIFFVGILQKHKEMNNPTFLIQVDRNDLDNQLHDCFMLAKNLVGDVKHAENVDDLREALQTEGGGVIFSTIEKFRLVEDETKHPVLSERRNIIVIADEAHRTQYGLLDGFAYHLRQALPKASFIGFTGTPVDLEDRDTQAVFGNIIHTYDIPQAQEDNAIVPIYYEARLVKQQLVNPDIDKDLLDIAENMSEIEVLKAKWAAIKAIAGTEERLEEISGDILSHFKARTESIAGKGMIVCMSRRICVDLYNKIRTACPDWHDKDPDKGKIKIIMTGDITNDPKEWNEEGHITTKRLREKIKTRFKDPKDELKLVIVVDMWLTGTDIPCLHTLYVDKPMKDHNLMQAIARVNRVFKDKPGGLVVDYIGIGHYLKEAARKFTASGYGSPSEELEEYAIPKFMEELNHIREHLPSGATVHNWRDMGKIAFEDFITSIYSHIMGTEDKCNNFLISEKRLSAAYSLVKHIEECRNYADEIIFYQLLRGQLNKVITSPGQTALTEKAVKDLIDTSIRATDMVDIFKTSGINNPDISILDDKFLEEFKSKEQENLRLKLLEKLFMDEIKLRQKKNIIKYRSFKEMIEATLNKYHNNAITASEVIKAMLKIREEMIEEDKRKKQTGLTEEELAFYDLLATLGTDIYDMPFICNLVREIVQSLKKKLKVDWTKSHREDVKAEVRSAVKMVLRKNKVKAEQFQFILNRVMEQAEALYENWPMAA